MSGDQASQEDREDRAGLRELLRPRLSRGQLAGGLLCLLLGFAVVAQVETTRRDTTFAAAREDELVGVLSDLSQRSERLRGDLRELEDTRARLERDGQGTTALEDARERATAYGLLAGTLPAEGPGIELTVEDPAGRVRAVHLLDALQELRDAGAEVVQVNDVRAGTGTYFVDAAGGVVADGRFLRAPYRFLVIGDAHTMTTALDIPGGVIKTLEGAGARVGVSARPKVEIRATRPG
ncbi:DUF881 domain-containing protein [Spirillospora sp. NPDC029432]|uniref:DUF881 domain-containing protein n=1 Tax=Spirillospora sp. NPDC029432 TaxID=3154599 RepID=UPI0034565B02